MTADLVVAAICCSDGSHRHQCRRAGGTGRGAACYSPLFEDTRARVRCSRGGGQQRLPASPWAAAATALGKRRAVVRRRTFPGNVIDRAIPNAVRALTRRDGIASAARTGCREPVARGRGRRAMTPERCRSRCWDRRRAIARG